MIDDHPLSVHALTAVLEQHGHIVLAVAGGPLDAIAVIERHRPQVAIVDLGLPEPGGVAVVRRVARVEGTRALVCTGSLEPIDLQEALAAGASGITSKASPLETVVDGVEAVAAGRVYLDARVREALAATRGPAQTLTARERQILQLVAEGLNLEEVAQRLFLSAETVRTHVRNARRKLGARTRTEAVVAAMRSAQIRMPD